MPCQQGGLPCNREKYWRVGGIMREDKGNKCAQARLDAQLCKGKQRALCETKMEGESPLPRSDSIHDCYHWSHVGQLQCIRVHYNEGINLEANPPSLHREQSPNSQIVC